MAARSARPVAGVAATKLAEAVSGVGASVLLKNKTATASVFLGGSTVTTATGFEWEVADGPLSVDIPNGGLYGIVAATPQTIHVLGSSSS